MRDRADKTAAPRRRFGAGDMAFYGLTVGAVVLGWQIAIQPLAQRAPVEVAIRLAPASPQVLRRAAEAELAAGRDGNAAALAREALSRAPFDVKSLRVVGLTEAGAGRTDRADELLTLAGNWSLRDDPTHAWLIEHRLRRGDYASAFAHADTLVRRRQDIQPEVFRLFTLAGVEDSRRSLPVTASLLAANPPWRQAYFDSLSETPEDLQVRMNLAILLQAGRTPLSNAELQGLYRALLRKGLIEGVRTVRGRLNRPPAGAAVTNGDFADTTSPEPFQWKLAPKAGIVAEIVADDLRPGNPALRVDYDGYATGTIAEQMVFLLPGSYMFSAQAKVEAGDPGARLEWTLTCTAGSGTTTSMTAGPPTPAPQGWTRLSGRFEISERCPVQWLRLETRATDRRSPTAVWYDQIAISPTG